MQIIPLLCLACSLNFSTLQLNPIESETRINNEKLFKSIVIDFEFDNGGCHYEVFAVWSSDSGGSGQISRNCGGHSQTIYFTIKKPPTVYYTRLQSGDIIATKDGDGNSVDVDETEKDLWISQINANWPRR